MIIIKMSFVSNVELKGTRNLEYSRHHTVSSPAGRKYITCVEAYMGQQHLRRLITQGYTTTEFDEEGKFIDSAGTAEYLLSGDTTAPTNVTPFIVKKASFEAKFRNNYTQDAVLTIFEVAPRTLIPARLSVASTTGDLSEGNVWSELIGEGIADKLNSAAVQTNGYVMTHTTAPGAGSASPSLHGVDHNEVSLNPQMTIYDSRAFTEHFKVVKQHTIKLKPKDTYLYKCRLPAAAFLDGILPYISTGAAPNADGALYYPFSRLIFVQLMGDLGHDSDTQSVGIEAAADPTTNRRAGIKQAVADVNYTKSFLDMITRTSMEFEIFDATLMQPGYALDLDAELAASNMNVNYTQVISDLN